jgi:hypothetical protein
MMSSLLYIACLITDNFGLEGFDWAIYHPFDDLGEKQNVAGELYCGFGHQSSSVRQMGQGYCKPSKRLWWNLG